MSSFSSLVRCSLLIILLVDEALMFKQHVRSGEPPTAFAQQAYGAPVTDMRSYIGIGCVGMDFDVMLPIEIVALGFYNPSANITPPQIQVAVFDRLTEETVPGADVSFSQQQHGQMYQLGLYSFLTLLGTVVLPVGKYSIVADGYVNGFPLLDTLFTWRETGASLPTHASDRKCPTSSVSFVGSSRYNSWTSSSLIYPSTIGQIAAQFAAGTFFFTTIGCAGPSPPSFAEQAYGTLAEAYYPGVNTSQPSWKYAAVGMDFDVLLPVTLYSIGIFNNHTPLPPGRVMQVAVFDRSSETPVDGTNAALTSKNTVMVGSFSMFGFDEPVTLPLGQYSIVSFGYGDGFYVASQGEVNQPTSGSDGKNCSRPSLAFVGSSRHSNSSTFGFPRAQDHVEAQFAAGTFTFSTISCPAGSDPPAEATLAYNTTSVLGNMFESGAVGMDFDVIFPVRLFSIGVLSNNYSILPPSIALLQVGIYDRVMQLAVPNTMATLTSDTTTRRGSYFMTHFDSVVILKPGNYSIVAFGFGADFPFFQGGSAPQPTRNEHCGERNVLSFTGTGRRAPNATRIEFPTEAGASISPAPYAAGTFVYHIASGCPAPPPPFAQQAYGSDVPVGFTNSPGSLGMDFVVNSPIVVYSIGVYSGNVSLPFPMQVGIFDTSSNLVVPETLVAYLTRDNSVRRGLYSMYDFEAPVELQNGSYTIVAFGYGNQFLFVDSGSVSQPTNGADPRCPSVACISFTGTSRFDLSVSLVFPTGQNNRAVAEFAAGTFTFASVACAAQPSSSTSGLSSLDLVLIGAAGMLAIFGCVLVVLRLRPFGARDGPSSTMASERTALMLSLSRSGSSGNSPQSPKRLVEFDGKLCTRLKLIGRGANGSVYTCAMPDGSIIALKEVLLGSGTSATQLQQAQREIEIASSFDHPNVVHFYGSCFDKDENKLTIFMELVSNGSLGSAVREMKSPMPDEIARVYTRQIVSGLAYIHSHGVVHRDLKCDNILLAQDGTCKLSDFGSSRKVLPAPGVSNGAQTIVGTPHFMAPEMLNGSGSESDGGYGRSADVWSLGITILEMMNCGFAPWPDLGSINATILHISSESAEPFMPESLSCEAADFVRCCCKRDPAQRSTSAALLNHRWIAADSFQQIASAQ